MSDRIVRQIFPKLPSDAADQQWKFSDFANRPNIVLVGDPGAGKSHLMREAAEASKRTGQTLIVDAYAAEVLKATGYDSIPKPVEGWPNIAIFIPQAQRVALKRKGIAPIVDSYRGFRVWPNNLAEQAPRSVMLFRGWMLKDLKRAGALVGARVFWSQWDGYARCIAFYLLSRLGFAAR